MNAVTQAQVSIEQFPVPEYIRAIAPYVGGKPIGEVAREFGLDEAKIIKLASNENPLGMPQSARDAMTRAFDEVARYPDANGHDLKQVISRKLNVPMDWITLGNGSNDILVLAAHAFLQPGAAAIYSQYSFVVYALATQEVGGRSVVVPATAGFGHDLKAMLAAIGVSSVEDLFANIPPELRLGRALDIPPWPGGKATAEDLPEMRLYYVRLAFFASAYVNCCEPKAGKSPRRREATGQTSSRNASNSSSARSTSSISSTQPAPARIA